MKKLNEIHLFVAVFVALFLLTLGFYGVALTTPVELLPEAEVHGH